VPLRELDGALARGLPERVVIERRFRGPSESANGGYACGLLGERIGGRGAEVSLRVPPPLERELRVQRESERLRWRSHAL